MIELDRSWSTRFEERFRCSADELNEFYENPERLRNFLQQEYGLDMTLFPRTFYGSSLAHDIILTPDSVTRGNMRRITSEPVTPVLRVIPHRGLGEYLGERSFPIIGEGLQFQVDLRIVYSHPEKIGPIISTVDRTGLIGPQNNGVVSRRTDVWKELFAYLKGTDSDPVHISSESGRRNDFAGDRIILPLRETNLAWMLENSGRVMWELVDDAAFQELAQMREALRKANVNVRFENLEREVLKYMELFGNFIIISESLDLRDASTQVTSAAKELEARAQRQYQAKLEQYQPSKDLRTLLENI